MPSIGTALAALTFVVSLASATPALAQAHKTTDGPCTLRSSTVDSRSIAASVAARHGFSRAADLAIVNVTVSCKGRSVNGTVPADIAVTRSGLAGVSELVEMHVERQNGYVSYYGTYPHLPGQLVRVSVTAVPEGTTRHMTLTYRQRFAAR